MMVSIQNLEKVIGSNRVLDNVSVDMPSACVTGLAGINGSGKTMLMRCICGFVKPTRGKVFIDGRPLGRKREFPESLGFLIEAPAFLDSYSGLDNLRLLSRIRAHASEADLVCALERVGLDPLLRKKYRAYSLGMKQRLGIAGAIMEQPALIVLDEPTNALDEEGVSIVRTIIREERERGACIVIASHDRPLLEDVCDRVFQMRAGKLVGAL